MCRESLYRAFSWVEPTSALASKCSKLSSCPANTHRGWSLESKDLQVLSSHTPLNINLQPPGLEKREVK